jgi:SAM-dependent methyltransferase
VGPSAPEGYTTVATETAGLGMSLADARTYRGRVLSIIRSVLRSSGPFGRVLDFGAGDGWFAQRMRDSGVASEVVGIDVQPRRAPLFDVRLYDGRRLPFEDRSFDLVYCVDVLHHCDDPRERLEDLLRCARRSVLLKDHTYSNLAGKLTLAALDEVGNRRFGIRSPRRYQKAWEWLPMVAGAGFELETLVHPAACHRGALGWATNRLQFVALWRRSP